MWWDGAKYLILFHMTFFENSIISLAMSYVNEKKQMIE